MGPNLLSNYFETAAMILFGIGFTTLFLQPNLIKKVIGLNIMDSAVYLFLAAKGYITGRLAPIVVNNVTDMDAYINPIPAGLVLTGIVVSVSVTALDAVPPEYEQGSLALGATEEETWFKVSIPAAKSGIAAGVVLGIGRAVGEAMAVMMVAGNSPNMPGLFRSVTFLTTAIAKEMSYASGLQKQALFSIALVLFLFIMGIDVVLNGVLKGGKKREQ